MNDRIRGAGAPRTALSLDEMPSCNTPTPAAVPTPEPDYQRVFDANPGSPDLRRFLEPKVKGSAPPPLGLQPREPSATVGTLDKVERDYAGPYKLADGSIVSAPPTFHSSRNEKEQLKTTDKERYDLITKLCAKEPLAGDLKACFAGYATPKQLVRVTQALIDAGQLKGVTPIDAQAIRKLQQDFCIGVHCMGFVRATQLALLGPTFDLNPNNHPPPYPNGEPRPITFKWILEHNHLYHPVPGGLAGVAQARPGDVLHLDKSAQTEGREHNVVIRQHDTLLDTDPRLGAIAGSKVAKGGGPVHLLDVMQSGGGPDDVRGVRHELWLFNEATGAWAFFDPIAQKAYPFEPGPQGHGAGTLYTSNKTLR